MTLSNSVPKDRSILAKGSWLTVALLSAVGFCSLATASADAAVLTVAGGQAVFNYDENAFNENVFQGAAFFNRDSNSLTYSQIVDVVIDHGARTQVWTLSGDSRGWTGHVYELNGPTVPPTTEENKRYLQATNFSYDPNDIIGTAVGQIGLGGMIRLESDYQNSNNTGSLLFGDFALFYSQERSRWELKADMAGFVGLSDYMLGIENSTLTQTETGFILSGDLYMDAMYGALASFYQVRQEGGEFVSIGNFTIEVQAIPEPSTIGLLALTLGGAFALRRRRQGVGSHS